MSDPIKPYVPDLYPTAQDEFENRMFCDNAREWRERQADHRRRCEEYLDSLTTTEWDRYLERQRYEEVIKE